MNDKELRSLFKRAEKSIKVATWTEFCRQEKMSASKMRNALYAGSQLLKKPIPKWEPKRGVRADTKIKVQKSNTVTLSQSRLPDAWEEGDPLDVQTGEDSVKIIRAE